MSKYRFKDYTDIPQDYSMAKAFYHMILEFERIADSLERITVTPVGVDKKARP